MAKREQTHFCTICGEYYLESHYNLEFDLCDGCAEVVRKEVYDVIEE